MSQQEKTAKTSLVINSPYAMPCQHWQFHYAHGEGIQKTLTAGRRPSGYRIASSRVSPAQSAQDMGVFVPIPLVETIRERVVAWREGGYRGATGVTRRLLRHWTDERIPRQHRFFFCQLEAIETLIWLMEAPENQAHCSVSIPMDGALRRLCSKMATGTGKTILMAFVIVWQLLNRVDDPKNKRYAKEILVVAPNLTVKERLNVLNPKHPENIYGLSRKDALRLNDPRQERRDRDGVFYLVPRGLREQLTQGKVHIQNWHQLQWDDEAKIRARKSVDKRGPLSDDAYVRDVLGLDMAYARDIVVLNDEAHHAWRMPEEMKEKSLRGEDKKQAEEATQWIRGLERLHHARNVLCCYDFSATPYIPSLQGKTESLFPWIVSDFSLNDAIEAGIVKTPRAVVRDGTGVDTKTYRPRFEHLYDNDEVKNDLNRRAKPEEELPFLVTDAYATLARDWHATLTRWQAAKALTPPVMISVVNRTETAARVEHMFKENQIGTEALGEPDKMLRIDSHVLEKMDKTHGEALLRRKVSTIGKKGKEGAAIHNVIAVNMLSEGWDAQTVTHIMGLRAFRSQLLCEQVIGRGLRRSSYEVDEETGLYTPEHVDVFGVPFSFLPCEEGDDLRAGMFEPLCSVAYMPERSDKNITWPRVQRINVSYRPSLALEDVTPLTIDAATIPKIVELAPKVDNQPDLSDVKAIDIRQLGQSTRMQTLFFKTAKSLYREITSHGEWPGHEMDLVSQLVRLVGDFLLSPQFRIKPQAFHDDPAMCRAVIYLRRTQIMRHIQNALRLGKSADSYDIIVDKELGSTEDTYPYRTSKACDVGKKTPISCYVYDSTWEQRAAALLERHEGVVAWVKNGKQVGFIIDYVYQGVVKHYFPDFLARLTCGKTLIIETKGIKTEESEAKKQALELWVAAVNAHGGYGVWASAQAGDESAIHDVLATHCESLGKV
ncbi:MAG: DEAD/DEAH box helicase family protein [Alphaproteobacteria bacterium GM7ARS4]|nr:DEAD/DEAH box helicase family protein [Alphaproteobacteria bacterium GM7ARS4]